MAGIGSPRQCRSGIDEADQPCHTGPAPVPRCARVGLDTGMNLAVRTGVGPASSAVSCSRSSTASRFPRHPPLANRTSQVRLRSPYGLPPTHPKLTLTRGPRVAGLNSSRVAWLFDAAIQCRIPTAIHTWYRLVEPLLFLSVPPFSNQTEAEWEKSGKESGCD